MKNMWFLWSNYSHFMHFMVYYRVFFNDLHFSDIYCLFLDQDTDNKCHFLDSHLETFELNEVYQIKGFDKLL